MQPSARFRTFFCLLLAIPGLLSTILLSQEQPREILSNRGFNHPKDQTTGWTLRSGGMGAFSFSPDRQSPDNSNIISIKVGQVSPKPWTMELLHRLEPAITRNSVLRISFDYKITPGYVFHFYWQVETSPWPKLLSLRITEPAGEWKHLSVTVPVHEGHAADTTALSFHLAETLGELQLKNISVLLMPPGTDPAEIPSTIAPVLGGDFYDKDWRAKILQRIQDNRVSPLTLKILRNNKPVQGAEITLRQLSNDMLLGAEASGALLRPECLNSSALRDQRRQISPVRQALPRYKSLVLDREKFDFISIYDAFIWKEYDQWGNKIAPDLIQDIRKNGQNLSIPGLYIPAYMFSPTRCRNMSADRLWDSLFGHLKTIAGKYGPQTGSFGVLHGPVKYSEIYHFIGVESLPEAFRTVRSQAPRVPCYISSPDALGALSSAPLNDLLELITWLQNEDTRIDGIILQANFHELNVAPQTLERRLALFAQKCQLPIHIRNFAVNEEKDDVQADMIRDFLLLFYAEPSVASLSLGEQWSAALLNPRLGYYRADFTPRQSALILRKLLYDEWRSDRTGATDKDGLCAVSLYHGKYSITVKTPEKQINKIIHTRDIPQNRQILLVLP